MLCPANGSCFPRCSRRGHGSKVGDKTFLIELVYSERFGWLGEHELVVERE